MDNENQLESNQPEEAPKRVPPPPPPVRPKEPEPVEPKAEEPPAQLDSDVNIRTMERDLKAVEGEEEKEMELKPETVVPTPVLSLLSPKKKTWLFIVGGVVAGITLGLLGYFIIFPLLFSAPEPTTPPPAGKPVVSKPVVVERHQSYFVVPASATTKINLSNVNLLNISIALQNESAVQLPDGTLKEVEILDGEGGQVAYSEFMLQFLPGTGKVLLEQLFERDFTAYLYYDNQGVWPGYVAKVIDPIKASAEIKATLRLSLENVSGLPAFYITTPGVFSVFKDGRVADSPTRYSVGSQPSAAFNYGVFGDYFVMSTSYDGLKAALQLLGL